MHYCLKCLWREACSCLPRLLGNPHFVECGRVCHISDGQHQSPSVMAQTFHFCYLMVAANFEGCWYKEKRLNKIKKRKEKKAKGKRKGSGIVVVDQYEIVKNCMSERWSVSESESERDKLKIITKDLTK